MTTSKSKRQITPRQLHGVVRPSLFHSSQPLTAVGEKVKFSELAITLEVARPGKTTTGMVTGESRDGRTLYVKRDGCKSTKAYATEYWELA